MPAFATVDAPTPSVTCPSWCSEHQRPDHPDDEIHWAEPDLPAFSALGQDARLMLCQYVREAGPTVMFELHVSPSDLHHTPPAAVEAFRALSVAFADLAAAAQRMADAPSINEAVWG